MARQTPRKMIRRSDATHSFVPRSIRRIAQIVLAITVALGALMAVPAAATENGTVYEERRMPSRILGKDVYYTVYLPPNYDAGNRKYPVVYLMHGGWDGRNEDWFRYGGVDQILDRMINSGELPPFIAVTPEGRRDDDNKFYTYYMNDADGGYRWEDMFLEEFLPHVESSYRIIEGKSARNIIGLSMGGYAAIAYSMKDPELFASAAVLSGAFRTDAQTIGLDQSGYDKRYGKAWGIGLRGADRLNEHYRANSVFELAKSFQPRAYGQTQFYIDCGADDVFFDGNAALHIAMRDLKISHRFRVREGKHDWNYWRMAVPDALKFAGDTFRK